MHAYGERGGVVSRRRLADDDGERRPDDPAIVELLDSVREARTALAIELAAAAGAIDAGHPEVARDIVAATAEEMRRVADHPRPVAAAQRPPRRAKRRILVALPAVPVIGAMAMTAAVALGGNGTPAGHHPVAHASRVSIAVVAPRTATAVTGVAGAAAHAGATTTLHRLEHVVTHHPQAAQVLAVADDLHDQLTEMIATATDDPARLHVVRQLLTLEQHVLESAKVPGTQLALAASRAIARLLDLVPVAHPTPTPHSATTTTPTRPTPARTPTASSSPHATQASPTASHDATSARAPRVTSKNALFGRGLFSGRRLHSSH